MANLFKSDFDIVREFISANVNNVWETIAPYIDEAQQKITPLLGPEMWDKLQSDLTASSTDINHLALLTLVRRAQANFGYLLFASDGTIQISDTGFLQVEEGGRKGAYQWQVREFKRARSERAWEAMHQILKLLMAKRDIYIEWSTSDSISEMLAVWLPTLDSFNKQRRIHGFETLWTLRPSMLFIQERVIRENIGNELYEQITEEFIDDDLTADNKILLNSYIAPVIAHLSIERASMELNFRSSSNGLRVDGIDAVSDNSEKEGPAGRTDAYNVRQDAEKKGAAALRELREYLNKTASATKYPTYFNDADLYPSESESSTFKNSGGASFWGV